MIQLADEGVCQRNLDISSGVRRAHLTRNGTWCRLSVVDTIFLISLWCRASLPYTIPFFLLEYFFRFASFFLASPTP